MDAGDVYRDQGVLAPKRIPAALGLSALLATLAGWVAAWLECSTSWEEITLISAAVFIVILVVAAGTLIAIVRIHRPLVGVVVSWIPTSIGCYAFLIFWVRRTLGEGTMRVLPDSLLEGLDLALERGVEHTIHFSRILKTGTHMHNEVSGSWYLVGGVSALAVSALAWSIVRSSYYCGSCHRGMLTNHTRWLTELPSDADVFLQGVCRGDDDDLRSCVGEKGENAVARLDVFGCDRHEDQGVAVLTQLADPDDRESEDKQMAAVRWLGPAALRQLKSPASK